MALGDKVTVVVDEGKGTKDYDHEVKSAGGSVDWDEATPGFITVRVKSKSGVTIRRSAYAMTRVVRVSSEPRR